MEYNVLTENWVPVVTQNGERLKVSVMDIAKNSKLYKSLDLQRPMEEFSVLLFLVTLFTDACLTSGTQFNAESAEEEDDEESAMTLDKKQLLGPNFPVILAAYIKQCESEGVSFDLFDKSHPFWQIWGDQYEKDTAPISVGNIDYSLTKGNNSLFINPKGEKEHVLTPAEAFISLLTVTRYGALQGGRGWKGSIYGRSPEFFIVAGNSLYDSIQKNSLSIPREGTVGYGTPWYRKMSSIASKAKVYPSELGWLNGTWFPRAIYKLIPDSDGLIRTVYKNHGFGCETADLAWFDPYQIYKVVEPKGKEPFTIALNAESDPFVCYNAHLFAGIRSGKHNIVKDTVANEISSGETVHLEVYKTIFPKDSPMSDVKQDLYIPSKIVEETEGEAFRILIEKLASEANGGVIRSYLQKSFSEGFPEAKAASSDFLKSAFDAACKTAFEEKLCTLNALEEGREDIEISSWLEYLKNVALRTFDTFANSFSNVKSSDRIRIASKRDHLRRNIQKYIDNKSNKTEEGMGKEEMA